MVGVHWMVRRRSSEPLGSDSSPMIVFGDSQEEQKSNKGKEDSTKLIQKHDEVIDLVSE